MELFTRGELLSAPAPSLLTPVRVRFQDVDAAGLIFYARVFAFFHDAYTDFLELHGHPLHEILAGGEAITPVVHTEASYLKPTRHGDKLDAALVRTRFEGSKMLLGFRLNRPDGGEATTLGQTLHMVVTPDTMKRTFLPEDLQRAFEAVNSAGAP